VLSNDISDLPVEIVAVLQPHTARGSVQINDDGSVTYYQKQPLLAVIILYMQYRMPLALHRAPWLR